MRFLITLVIFYNIFICFIFTTLILPLFFYLIYHLIRKLLYKTYAIKDNNKVRLESEGWILKSEWNRETQRAIDFKSENGQDWVKVE